jgi:Ca2+-binding RTX toxin-like protein
MHRTLVAAVVAAAAVVLPAAAQAATVERFDGLRHTVLVTGAPDETNLVSVDGAVISDLNMPLKLERRAPCKRLDDRTVRCVGVKRIALDLNDGPDVASIATSREVWLSGGAGDDRYVARGGDGPSRVDFSGGFGVDVANYGFATEGVRVGVDGMPFDGRPGDNDRIGRTVETVIGSNFADVLTGAERDQRLLGIDGDDEISGGPGQDVLEGGPGDDRIDARDGELDTVDCGGWLLDRVMADPVEASIIGCG